MAQAQERIEYDGWQALLRDATRDPSWLLYHTDFASDTAQLVQVDQHTYHESRFLDARMKVQDAPQCTVRLSNLIQALAGSQIAPLRWIFHSGQCGSTLLTHLLAAGFDVLPLREPLPLRSLAACWRERKTRVATLNGVQLSAASRAIRVMLSRKYANGGVPLVKATSDVSGLIPHLLGEHFQDRAVLLLSDLETYLTQMLRDVARRQEVARFAQTRLRDLHQMPTFSHLRLYQMNDAQRSAMCWLSVALSLTQGHAHQPERTILIDARALRQQPVQVAQSAARFLGLQASPSGSAAAQKQVLGRDAKREDSGFDPRGWEQAIQQARVRFGDEIDQGLDFVSHLLRRDESGIHYQKLLGSFIPS